MAFIPVVNVAAVHVRGSLGAQQTENVFYYKSATAITAEMLQDLVDALATHIIGNWLVLLPPQWVGREIYAEDLTEKPGAQATNVEIAGQLGAHATDMQPGNVTLAFQRSSGLSGRSARGRIYWQGIPEGVVTTNYVTSSFANAVVAALESTDAIAVALDWIPVIVSLYEDLAPRAAGVTFNILTWKWVDLTIDSMRRRLPGRGA